MKTKLTSWHSTLVHKRNIQKIVAVAIVLLLASIGTVLLANSHAASPYAVSNANNGTLTGNAGIVSSSAASDGKYVQFGCPTGDTGTPPSCSSGTTCGGSTPCADQVASATPVCGQYSQSDVTVDQVQWWRQTDNWGGGNVCLNQWDGTTVSYLVQSQSATGSGGVLAYPNLEQGYSEGGGGNHTANWTSLEESAIPSNASFSMYTNNGNVSAGTEYDTGADLWFSTTPTFSNRALEVFIALNSTSNYSKSDEVTIDGTTYAFNPYTQSGWVECTFEPQPQQTSVTNLDLVPFFNFLISKGYLSPSDYFVNAAFGNEINSGGTGLQLTGLSLTL